ncbi:McrC family protein [Labrys neptuniae]|uniref:Calmodulin-binding protein n=1 Tax=Labrys neptuniae TaxID=376174 RepID=A0ABV3PIJ2_9HYPH
MTHLTVHEWGRVSVGDGGFTRHQADSLLAAARRHELGGADGTDILCDHHRFLRARQMVGVIAGRDCSLEILPKVDPEATGGEAVGVRARLVYMLDVALGLDLSTGETAALAHRADSLLEIFITLFADRLLAEVRRGLPHLYRTHDDDLRTLRGQLDMVRQFTVHAVRPDRLACRFDVLDSDVPLMQVVKACVLLLARHARSVATQRKLAELRFLLAEVSDVAPWALPWSQVRIDRSSRRWSKLLDLARLLLGGRWQQTHAEARGPEGITLLFPMNELFERFVAVQLRRALAGTGLDVVAQGGFAYCMGMWKDGEAVIGDSHPTRPDILIKRSRHVVGVIDTKWKHAAKGVAHSDLYQMMAYSRLYACSRLILLYPALPGEIALSVDTRGIPPGRDRLDIATVPIEQCSAEIQGSLRQLVFDGERHSGTINRPAFNQA